MFVFLVFEDQNTALQAILQIDNLLNFPVSGTILATGETGIGSNTWAIPEQRIDGKWIIPLPPIDPDPAWGYILEVASREIISSWFEI